MTATFGKLQGRSLELGDGLNIIEAPNETGKSTWCAFLKAMFYGIDTRDRDRKGHLADKNRYQLVRRPMEGEDHPGAGRAGDDHHPPRAQGQCSLRHLLRRIYGDGGAHSRSHRRHLRADAAGGGPGGL